MFMKKIIVLQNKGKLANQLWLAASVYAYCLEKKFIYKNYSFCCYQNLFGLKSDNLFLDKILSRLPRKINRLIYFLFVFFLKITRKNQIISDKNKNFLLPPTLNKNIVQIDKIKKIEKNRNSLFYLDGWLFRNPAGLKKYKKQIKEYFKPKDIYYSKIKNFIKNLRKNNKFIIGVHIRHGDYKTWSGGKFFYSFTKVKNILDDFILNNQESKKIIFVICSDDIIDKKIFKGLNYTEGLSSPIEDLYTLSLTDMIIGSNSTFGSWAAYYGNIPFAQFSHKKINWKLYENLRINDNS